MTIEGQLSDLANRQILGQGPGPDVRPVQVEGIIQAHVSKLCSGCQMIQSCVSLLFADGRTLEHDKHDPSFVICPDLCSLLLHLVSYSDQAQVLKNGISYFV